MYAIELKKIEVTNGIIMSEIKYTDDDAYYDFNNLPLFYGSVAKAVKAGYSLNNPIINVETGREANVTTEKDISDSKIIILNIGTDVNTYKDIKYATQNVKVGDDHKTATVEGGATAYIVFD